MRIAICAVGRLKGGPEQALFDDYLTRFDKTGRRLGLGPARLFEVEDRKGGGASAEALLLEKAAPKGSPRIALDERGQTLSSPDFASWLARYRDQGCAELTFLIGGADGLVPELRINGLSFGKMVWPHMLARVMLAEQLYRAATILAGSPYHRT